MSWMNISVGCIVVWMAALVPLRSRNAVFLMSLHFHFSVVSLRLWFGVVRGGRINHDLERPALWPREMLLLSSFISKTPKCL